MLGDLGVRPRKCLEVSEYVQVRVEKCGGERHKSYCSFENIWGASLPLNSFQVLCNRFFRVMR